MPAAVDGAPVPQTLDPSLLDGLAAAAVHLARWSAPPPDVPAPTRALDDVLDDLDEIADEVRERERDAGLPATRAIDPGFVTAAHRWASGASLDEAMGRLDVTGGDFVRTVKQVADLVGQLRHVGDDDLAATAGRALDGLRRGIVDA